MNDKEKKVAWKNNPSPEDMELAEYCLKQRGCYTCPNDDMKKKCLANKCWKQEKVKDNKPPCVFYGLLPSHKEKEEV